MSTLSKAAQDVLAERQRQIETGGRTPEHDDAYKSCELGRAAACYAHAATLTPADREEMISVRAVPLTWPWHENWWKPTNRRRDLVKAGALILAEIERLDRAEQKR